MLTENQQSNNVLASAETMETINWVDNQLATMKYEKDKNERDQNEESSRDEDAKKMKIIESGLSKIDEKSQ